MFLNELVRRLRFLPLGLLWGLVAGSLTSYRYIFAPNGLLGFEYDISPNWWRVELIFLPIIGAMAGSLLIAVLLGSALLNRKLSSIGWLVGWVITGAASCAGGAAIFELIFILGGLDEYLEWMPLTSWYEIPFFVFAVVLVGGAHSLAFGVLIGIESTVVALSSAPLALLGRRLILRRGSVAEPAGGGSQARL